MATDSSTAAPKLMLSSDTKLLPPWLENITLPSIRVRRNKSAIATVLSLPRFLSPMRIQTIISAPITRHHTQAPVLYMLFAASAPS